MKEPEDGTDERPDEQSGQRSGDQVGSVSDEALKLLGAISGWAQDQGADLGGGLSDLAGHAAATARDIDQHLATGSADCTYCPVCRTVHAIRQTSPEVRANLAAAAKSLLQAGMGMLATIVPDDAGSGRGHEVERIDLDADNAHDAWPEDDE